MKDTNAPDFLWADVFVMVVYAINRTIGGCNQTMSPFEAFFSRCLSVSHMCVWFADMFVHHPKGLGAGKLGAHGHQVKFLGYPDGMAGYKTYDPQTHQVSITRAPIFREEAHPCSTAFFESAKDKLDEDMPMPDASMISPMPPPPSLPTSSSPSPPDPVLPSHPICDRHAPHHLNPTDFGAFSQRKEAIANAYEDCVNEVPLANIVTDELDDIVDLIGHTLPTPLSWLIWNFRMHLAFERPLLVLNKISGTRQSLRSWHLGAHGSVSAHSECGGLPICAAEEAWLRWPGDSFQGMSGGSGCQPV